MGINGFLSQNTGRKSGDTVGPQFQTVCLIMVQTHLKVGAHGLDDLDQKHNSVAEHRTAIMFVERSWIGIIHIISDHVIKALFECYFYQERHMQSSFI